MFNHKCKSCEIYKEQIEYLKKMIDNIFISRGIAPIINQAETVLEESEEEKADRALKERGGIRYGE